MRIVTAGIGLRAGHVLSIIRDAMPESRIVGYYDPHPTHLDMIGADIPAFPSVEAMLSETAPDLFLVGSPNRFHLEQIKAGLAAGVPHILTEKPVVISKEETLALAEALAAHPKSKVAVGLVLRYSQHMVDLRAALSQGVLGRIASLEANEHIAPYHGAFFMRDWRRTHANSGGFLLEKCCHDIDLYNMITGSRPRRVASFGGRRSFLPDHAPASNSESDIFHVKKSVWDSVDDPFRSDGDIIDFQTALFDYESGASLAFHTNLNVPDEHRRFCVIGSHGMAEGDFVRGFLRVTRRDGSRFADHDYSGGDQARKSAHYGADHMMVDELVRFWRGEVESLPVGIVDALEAGVAALAADDARRDGVVVDLADFWAKFDSFGLREL